MTAPSQPLVPPELCDIVVDHLHDDPPALATCALVCRGWLPSSRMHQFHTLVLHRFPEWRGQKLSLISDPSSTILPYVRHLALGEGRGREVDPYWLDDALPGIRVDDLEGLECLELFEIIWTSLSPESLARLLALCRRPRSVALRLFHNHSVVPLIHLLQACASAEKFTIHGSFVHGHDDEIAALVPGSFTMSPHLRYVEMPGYMYPFYNALRRLAPEHGICTIYFASLYANSAASAARFLQWCGHTIEEITLDFPDPRLEHNRTENHEAPFYEVGGLKDNTSLRTINLNGTPPGLLAVLKQVTSKIVDTVSISLDSESPDLDFGAFGEPFSKGVLASAKLRIIASGPDVKSLVEMRDMLYGKLPLLQKQGRLVVERAGGQPIDTPEPPTDVDRWGAFPMVDMALDHYFVSPAV
ncbi:uncharacterized protein C8Q71DRAFT_719347 [Rhodofomes roseus]|uniref:F-box domain-containing protein n=1 Tax=Rhodofomes roseus TaxID=34475 RepID=A0ABQ8KXV4_9APHY|nr:uncharacterized protein C8Q71DRAFT_719347 [Rhodofomes roseus]KAH9843591.1 hypothetical protein C8Q71DRAFT_719347 [Rhodofomes roseus]